jgi:hypothetical protein
MKIIEVIQAARFFSITCNEVITINDKTWCLVHVYIIQKFGCFYMLHSNILMKEQLLKT